MTNRQHEALTFIKSYMGAHDGIAPSFDEMREALGYASKSHVFRLMKCLEEQGFIRRLRHRARAIEVVENPALGLSNVPDAVIMEEVERRWPGSMALHRLVAITDKDFVIVT